MDFLKDALGEDLFAQVAQKLEGSEIKLADLSGGEYVGRHKYAALEQQFDAAQQTILERDAQLTQLEAMNPDGMKAEIERLRGENQAAREAAEVQIAEMKLDSAVRQYAERFSFTSELAKDAFITGFKAQGFKQDEKGIFLGADDYTRSVREKNPAAFTPEPAQSPGFSGKQPPGAAHNWNDEVNAALRAGFTAD